MALDFAKEEVKAIEPKVSALTASLAAYVVVMRESLQQHCSSVPAPTGTEHPSEHLHLNQLLPQSRLLWIVVAVVKQAPSNKLELLA